jgi:hypothetical protein
MRAVDVERRLAQAAPTERRRREAAPDGLRRSEVAATVAQVQGDSSDGLGRGKTIYGAGAGRD